MYCAYLNVLNEVLIPIHQVQIRTNDAKNTGALRQRFHLLKKVLYPLNRVF